MKKPDYQWICHFCGATNEAHLPQCAACGFTAVASANDIDRSKVVISNDHVNVGERREDMQGNDGALGAMGSFFFGVYLISCGAYIIATGKWPLMLDDRLGVFRIFLGDHFGIYAGGFISLAVGTLILFMLAADRRRDDGQAGHAAQGTRTTGRENGT